MINNNIVLQTSKVLTLNLNSAKIQTYVPACNLKWRQKNLWVKSIDSNSDSNFPALTRKYWLENCLRNSWVNRICVDQALGEQGIKLWADTCDQANKPIFIRIPSNGSLPSCSKAMGWKVKRIFDWLAAMTILMLVSPVLLLIALLIKVFSPGPIFFSQWRVGERGKLFKMYKFRTMAIDAEQQHHQVMGNQNGLHKKQNDPRVTRVGKWLRKYSLDEFPQLFNVLRGEMSLVGPRPWALYDALRLGAAGKKRLNALPGMTGPWQVQARSSNLELDAVTKYDLDYLNSWSISKDLKILLMTVPKVISGFGAY